MRKIFVILLVGLLIGVFSGGMAFALGPLSVGTSYVSDDLGGDMTFDTEIPLGSEVTLAGNWGGRFLFGEFKYYPWVFDRLSFGAGVLKDRVTGTLGYTIPLARNLGLNTEVLFPSGRVPRYKVGLTSVVESVSASKATNLNLTVGTGWISDGRGGDITADAKLMLGKEVGVFAGVGGRLAYGGITYDPSAPGWEKWEFGAGVLGNRVMGKVDYSIPLSKSENVNLDAGALLPIAQPVRYKIGVEVVI